MQLEILVHFYRVILLYDNLDSLVQCNGIVMSRMTLSWISADLTSVPNVLPVESDEVRYSGWEPLTRLDQLNRCQMKPLIVVV